MVVVVVLLSNVLLVLIVVGVAVGVETKNAIVQLVASFYEVFVDSGCNCDVGGWRCWC